MPIVPEALRARLRPIRRGVSRTLVGVFIVLVAAVPLPLLPFMAFMIKPWQRNVPAAVIKKKGK